MQTALAFGADQ